MKHSFGRPPDGAAAPKPRRKQTNNEKLIRAAMKERGVKGNPRDFVLIVNDRLVDYQGGYGMFKINEEETESQRVQFEGTVALVHKRDLHKISGPEVAGKFWNQKLGIRVPQVKPPEKKS